MKINWDRKEKKNTRKTKKRMSERKTIEKIRKWNEFIFNL